MMDPLEQLREAIENEGPKPRYHREVMERHRREWPTLWAAIDRLLGEAKDDENLRTWRER